MSSELRLKKLRGSGGFVMATVTDDQQRKGNLGGPDLFLAPMGRIDSNLISKFYCNTCEQEYEGAPKIDYENPNEEVAENLILAEKGQYVCTTCGSTIAEYRNFTKPNEESDVGIARPISPEPNVPPQPSLNIEPAMPDFDLSSLGETSTQTEVSLTNQTQGSYSSISGMTVFDENARKVGIAKQVGVDSAQSVVLVITKNDGTEISIPWDKIRNVGDVILLGKKDDEVTQTSVQMNQTSCSSCGFDNKQGSKFCENCGTQL